MRSATAAPLLSSHFGVTLQLDAPQFNPIEGGGIWTYPFVQSSFTPTLNTATADYVVDDWYGHWSTAISGLGSLNTVFGTYPLNDEPYDVEAVYIDDDPYNIYIAIVTSFPPAPGLTETRPIGSATPPALVVAGDIALDFGLNVPLDGFRYDYGVNVNLELMPSDPTTQDATAGPAKTFPSLSLIHRTANSDWYPGTSSAQDPANLKPSNYDPTSSGFSGVPLAFALTDYYQLSFGGNEENNAPTYVLEAILPRYYFGGLDPGDTFGVRYTMGCVNNVNLVFTADIDTEFIPEPSSLVLLAAGLGLAWRRRRPR
jgi:hypothetical protein